MTLLELLVSLGVLALIGVAFGAIISQTQKVVNTSNALMRANADASAISGVIREDLTRLSPEGFLAVYQDPIDPNQSHLVFTAVGPFASKIISDPSARANAARIDYGLQAGGVLWRRAILLGASGGSDCEPGTFLGLYAANPGSINQGLIKSYCAPPTPPVPTEINTLADVANLWPMLAASCASFKVTWWDVGSSGWKAPDPNEPKIWTSGMTLPEAVRVQYRLTAGQGETDYLDYEVICPVRP